MPYANSQGVRIHYKVEGDGPPLVLQHGYTQSLERWYQSDYVDALKSHNKLILIDARGQGASDKQHDKTAYAWPIMVKDVLTVLNSQDINRAAFWGYSMGGGIGFGLASYAPERVRSLVIGGASAEASDLGNALHHVDGKDPEKFVAAFEARLSARFPADFREMLLANDTQALAAAAQNRPSMKDDLPNMTMPCLLYIGEADGSYHKAEANAKQMPRATFLPLPGLNHAEAFRSAKLVLPPVIDFLKTNIEDVTAAAA